MHFPSDDTPAAAPRLTWPAFAACLVALTALYLTSQAPLLLLIGLGLTAAQLLADSDLPRFEEKTLPLWAARAALAAIAIFGTPRSTAPGFDGLLDAKLTAIGGQLVAAELMLRLWMTGQNHFTRYRWVVVFSGILMIAACNTFEAGYIRFLAPLYLLCIAWTLIEFNQVGAARPDRAHRRTALLVRGIALAVAFGGGWGLYYVLTTYRNEVTAWSNRILLPRNTSGGGTAPAPELRSGFNEGLSPARVLRVEGMSGVVHLRGATYESYSAGKWGPALFNQKFRAVTDRELGAEARGDRARFIRFKDEFQLLFLPAQAAGIPNAERLDLRWTPEHGGAVQGQGAVFMPFTYEVALPRSEGTQGPLRRKLSPEDRARYVKLPEDLDPRIRTLADRIGGVLKSPAGRVQAVQSYLRSNFKYSLSFQRQGGDPVADFLTRKAAAHCQYFAASTVLLLRCLGVPARYVNGYYAHESGGNNILIVRERDAHAWAEVWIDGEGWATVDSTPSDGRPDSFSAAVPAWMTAWERLQDGVMSFGGKMGLMAWVWLIGGLTAVYVVIRSWGDLFRPRRRGAAAAGYSGPNPDLASVAARFETVLRDHGLPCPPQRTWEDHLSAAEADARPRTLDLVRAHAFLTEYNAVRFGRPDDRQAVGKLAGLLRDLERRREETAAARVE